MIEVKTKGQQMNDLENEAKKRFERRISDVCNAHAHKIRSILSEETPYIKDHLIITEIMAAYLTTMAHMSRPENITAAEWCAVSRTSLEMSSELNRAKNHLAKSAQDDIDALMLALRDDLRKSLRGNK